MTYTLLQSQTAYKNLPPDLQDYIMSNETTDIVTELIKEVNLPTNQVAQADSEVWRALLGLQTLPTAIKNISGFSGKSENELSKLSFGLGNRVFKKFQDLNINHAEWVESTQAKLKNPAAAIPQTSSANLPEIPPTNLPMIEPGEVAHKVAPSSDVHPNQPGKKNLNLIDTPNYAVDPYKEPLL